MGFSLKSAIKGVVLVFTLLGGLLLVLGGTFFLLQTLGHPWFALLYFLVTLCLFVGLIFGHAFSDEG